MNCMYQAYIDFLYNLAKFEASLSTMCEMTYIDQVIECSQQPHKLMALLPFLPEKTGRGKVKSCVKAAQLFSGEAG